MKKTFRLSKRLAAIAAAAILIFAYTAAPAFAYSDYTTDRYDVAVNVTKAHVFQMTEKIKVDFQGEHHVSMFADSLAGTLSAVECGFGMTILASAFIIQERKNSKMKFIPIADAGESEMWMIWRKGREDVLIEKMKETVMEIYADAEK